MSKKKIQKKFFQNSDGLNPIPVFIVKHPWVTICISLGIALAMTFGCLGFKFKYDETMTNFVVRKGKTADQIEGVMMVFREETFFDSGTYEYMSSEHQQQTQVVGGIGFYYECTDCDNLITEEHLERIYKFEQKILNNKEYPKYCLRMLNSEECIPRTSFLDYFYEDGEQIADLQAGARNLYNNEQDRREYCDKNFNAETLKCKFMSSGFGFGGPLEGYKNKDDRTSEQEKKFEDWIINFLPDLAEETNTDNFEILYLGNGITMKAINDLILHDTLLINISLVLVYIYTFIHTKTIVLTLLGIFHVMLSLPMSYFFYTAILGVEWFSMLNFLSLFVVLGIGCDDLFIMLDAWRQSKHQSQEVSKNKFTRMNWAYNRASITMLITTITSTGAFFGNIASTIPPIRYFGIFTGMAIVFNYLLVITWFPAVIVIWSRNGEGQCCCGGCMKKSKNKSKNKGKGKTMEKDHGEDPDYDPNNSDVELETKNSKKDQVSTDRRDESLDTMSSETDSDASTKSNHSQESLKLGFDIEKLRILEKYFYKYHVTFLKKYRWAIVIVFIGIFAAFTVQTAKLRPAEEATEFLPNDHFLKRAIDADAEEFSKSGIVKTAYIQWGVKGIDREGVDPLEVDDLGEPIYDKDWQPHLKSSQEWVIEVCRRLREEYEGSLYRNGQLICFMEDFRAWVTNETLAGGSYTFPVEEDRFEGLLYDFTNYARREIMDNELQPEVMLIPYTYENTIAFDKKTKELRMYDIQFNLVINGYATATKTRPVFDKVEDFVDQINKDAPSGMRMAGNVGWSWMEMLTEEILVKVAITTIIVSLAIAYIIILVSTDNLIISLLAIISIGGIVVTIIGMMVSLGWELGVIESVSMTIIVGICVDYIVHFCHAYNIAPYQSSFNKLRVAITNLGISVVSAAITTLFASFVMILTYFTMFKRFGIFIWMTIFSSVLWSFIFFFCLLIFFGPTGDKGKLSLIMKKIFCKQKYKEYLESKAEKENVAKDRENSKKHQGTPLDDQNFVEIESPFDHQEHTIDTKKQKQSQKQKHNSSSDSYNSSSDTSSSSDSTNR
ncbi:sterol-sensing domain [Anaeramoeba flamelloides]|uniref:Sterol-sensing domain n=1 Tax=Anaeramoeba flamelloides TaxID=1746091 RepID=A0AAV7Z7L5_9EUKA|nr:sterol-sensing domain [Anaeramoeba flamelloides]